MKNKSPAPTVRSLARSLGLSRTTVADALNGRDRVSSITISRVLQAADQAGYQKNPLVASMMSYLRQSGNPRRVLAAIGTIGPGQIPDPFFRELVQAAQARAEELGFTLEQFVVRQRSSSIAQLQKALRSRRIPGLLVLPSAPGTDWSPFDWSPFASVCLEGSVDQPGLARATSDHSRSLPALLEILRARGYRRPGLVFDAANGNDLRQRITFAFQQFCESHGEDTTVPPLVTADRPLNCFKVWFTHFKPDVVIGHNAYLIDAMTACGARVPQTHGFVSLNIHQATRPCAGLDPQPQGLGRRAIELVIAQLQRDELGISPWPVTTAIPSRWMDGPTIRTSPPVSSHLDSIFLPPKKSPRPSLALLS